MAPSSFISACFPSIELTEKQWEIVEEIWVKVEQETVYLATLSKEQRLAWFREHQYPHPIKFFYFSLFSVDKAQYIFRCVQLFPANQLRLSADSVQTAAFLPQLRG